VLQVLVVDVGGSKIKVRGTGQRKLIKIPSGPKMTARAMVREVKESVSGWTYDVVSVGYPGVVLDGRVVSEPRNLGGGWVGFNFARAFGRPVIVINDAAMQALGGYKGGRMLFLGLGTGLGVALIVERGDRTDRVGSPAVFKGAHLRRLCGRDGTEAAGKEKVATLRQRCRDSTQGRS
jgi:polyphosphate glucokinase